MRKRTQRKHYRASNPVKDKITRAKLRSTLLELKVRSYMEDDGEDVTKYLVDLATVIAPVAIGAACQYGKDLPWVRQLLGAMRSIQAMCLNGYRWDSLNAAPLTIALDLAEQHMDEINLSALLIGIEQGLLFGNLIRAHQVTNETVQI